MIVMSASLNIDIQNIVPKCRQPYLLPFTNQNSIVNLHDSSSLI